MGSGHAHVSPASDRRWLTAALVVIVAFMAGEVVAGIAAGSLALLSDAGHMLTDAAALLVAVVSSRIAHRPARGAFTYGFARVDALSAQANGITLLLLAAWFEVEAVRRLIHPGQVHGGVVTVVALVGAGVNVLALLLAGRADARSLNVRGAVAHLMTDAWAFGLTFVAGVLIVTTGWTRADPLASAGIGLLMAWTGARLVRAAGRIFLEAAPAGVDPGTLGEELVRIEGVAEVHDLHVWQIGPGEAAVSAHVLVRPPYDCHEVSGRLRRRLADRHGIGHVTLEVDHAEAALHDADHCEQTHGDVHVSPP